MIIEIGDTLPIVEDENWSPTQVDYEMRNKWRDQVKKDIVTKKMLQESGHTIDPLDIDNLVLHGRDSFTEDQLGAIFMEKSNSVHLPADKNVLDKQDQSMAYAYGDSQNRFVFDSDGQGTDD